MTRAQEGRKFAPRLARFVPPVFRTGPHVNNLRVPRPQAFFGLSLRRCGARLRGGYRAYDART